MYVNELKVAGVEYLPVELQKNDGLAFNGTVAERMVKQIDHSIDAVYLDSPNNPTGQQIPLELMEQIVAKAYRCAIPVIVDEAYSDFLSKDSSALVLLKRIDNVIVVRSFSKGFGLAGIRVGYGICRGMFKDAWQKVDIPATLSTVTTALAAQALQRIDFLEACKVKTRELKQQLLTACRGFIICETHPDGGSICIAVFWRLASLRLPEAISRDWAIIFRQKWRCLREKCLKYRRLPGK